MDVTKRFAKYVSQNIAGMIGVSCYIIVDTFFISIAAGANGITVLNLALPIFNLIFAIGSMTGVGSATRFAILRARKEKSDYLFFNAVAWVIIIGLIFTLAGIFIPDKIIRIMGGDESIVQLGIPYNRIFLLFSPFFMLNYVVSSFVRNDNDTLRAMIGTVIGSISNIILDYIFMFPMKMGLAGAALATAASPVISILICLTHFLSSKNTIRLEIVKPSVKQLIKSWQLGISAFVGEMTSGVTTTIFNLLILGIAGNVGVAAYGVVANFSLIAVSVFNGISQGAQPLISECFGKKEKNSQKKLLFMSIVLSLVIAVAMNIGIYTFTDNLVELFNSEHSVLLSEYAYKGLRLYFMGFLFAGINIICSGYFSATDSPLYAFIISILRGVVTLAACSVILSKIMGFTGVWISFTVSEGITAAITFVLLMSGNRENKE